MRYIKSKMAWIYDNYPLSTTMFIFGGGIITLDLVFRGVK